jgi:hypothetical protein
MLLDHIIVIFYNIYLSFTAGPFYFIAILNIAPSPSQFSLSHRWRLDPHTKVSLHIRDYIQNGVYEALCEGQCSKRPSKLRSTRKQEETGTSFFGWYQKSPHRAHRLPSTLW